MALPNFVKIRKDFPMLKQSMHGKPLVYLDSAATAQKPQIVIDKLTEFYQKEYATVHRAVYQLSTKATADYDAARLSAQQFLKAAKPDEIIFTRGTTESINLIAYSFGKAFIQPGDEVIISEIEHHSNIVPWQLMCEDRKAILKVIPVNDRGELLLDTYASILSKKTKIVAVNHISNALGTLNPIQRIISMAHEVGSKVLIDGAQSAPHLPINVQELDADFFVFSGHKLYGPTGIGILYGKAELMEAMPPYQGGGDMIETVTFPKTHYQPSPLKFEAGTPMFAEAIGLGTAIKYIQNIGIDRIHNYETELFAYATERMQKVKGVKIIGTAEKKGSLISFVVEGAHHLDVGTLLDLHGIAVRTGHHCAQPAMRRFNISGTVRASFAFYNTKDEIDFFVDTLKICIKQLKR